MIEYYPGSNTGNEPDYGRRSFPFPEIPKEKKSLLDRLKGRDKG